MGTQREFRGGSHSLTISADQQLNRKRAWVWVITASAPGLAIQLPDARTLEEGYPVIQVVIQGSNAIAIEDFDGTVLIASFSPGADDVATFALFDNSTAAGSWEWGLWTFNSTGAAPAIIFPVTLGGQGVDMLDAAFRYDFTADSWSEGAGASTANFANAAGARIQGTGYVGNNLLDHERYDPESWSVRTDHSYNRSFTSGRELSLTEDRAYYFGAGVVADGSQVDYYDHSADTFTDVTDMSSNRWKGQVTRSGTLFYIMTGAVSYLANHAAVVTVTEYDQIGDSHSALTDIGIARIYSGGATDNDEDPIIYCGAAHSNQITIYDDVEKYSISGDSWSVLANYPSGNSRFTYATHIEANGRNYVGAGLVEGGAAADHRDLSHHIPLSDTYATLADHITTGDTRGVSQSTLSLSD